MPAINCSLTHLSYWLVAVLLTSFTPSLLTSASCPSWLFTYCWTCIPQIGAAHLPCYFPPHSAQLRVHHHCPSWSLCACFCLYHFYFKLVQVSIQTMTMVAQCACTITLSNHHSTLVTTTTAWWYDIVPPMNPPLPPELPPPQCQQCSIPRHQCDIDVVPSMTTTTQALATMWHHADDDDDDANDVDAVHLMPPISATMTQRYHHCHDTMNE